jgi:phage baseplate assembly protein gpV
MSMWPAGLPDLFFAHIAAAEEERGRVYEPVIGLVTSNKDPDKLGRVKLRFPTLSSDDDSAWAPVVSIGAGAQRGWFFLPEVDDEVLVMFEHGDIARPIVIGALWNGKDQPPHANGDGANKVRGFVSRGGSTITFDDDAGTVTIADGGGKGTLTIDKQNKITLEAKTGDVVIACKDDLTIVAKEVELTATTQLEISSAGGDVKGGSDANVTVKGAAMVQVQGAQTGLDNGGASAPAMPQASPEEVPMELGKGGGGASGGGAGSSSRGGSSGGSSDANAPAAAPAPDDAPPGNPIPQDAPPEGDPPTDSVEVTVVDQDGAPLGGVAYELRASDGSVRTGTSNPEGVIREDRLPPGECTLTLPDLDEDDWSIA